MERLSSTFFACAIALSGQAQLTVTDSLPATELASLLEGFGVTILNVDVQCDPIAFGHFEGSSSLPITEGLVMTTGKATDVAAPGASFASHFVASGSDPDLVTISGGVMNDACVLSFDCIPQGDTLLFNYVFGSEEYPEFVCSFNDAFGLFLSGPGINGPYTNGAVNVALVPGTSVPVSINTVNGGLNNNPNNPGCPAQNAQYYMDNSTSTTIAYDGLTVNLTATVVVEPDQVYHFKAAIGDALDQAFDSGVFFEAFSFRSNPMSTAVGQDAPLKPLIAQHGDELVVRLPEGHGGHALRVLGMSGQELAQLRIASDRISLHLGNLPQGIYLLQVIGDRPMAPVRFVKH